MYNRKFDIKKDFAEENEIANEIMPIIRKIQDEEEREKLAEYLKRIYSNQWKK